MVKNTLHLLPLCGLGKIFITEADTEYKFVSITVCVIHMSDAPRTA